MPCLQWCTFTTVYHQLQPVTLAVQQPETTATQAGAHGFNYGQCGANSDRGIEGITALRQHFHSGLGRQRMCTGDGRRRWTRGIRLRQGQPENGDQCQAKEQGGKTQYGFYVDGD
jgi:hypothetical protein